MEKLLERERELAAVEVLLERGGILVVEGRAGIGKTSLVEVACRRAEERGHETLRARGSELEADFAFGVVRQLFERRLAGADVKEREALLVGAAGAVRPLLFGQLLEASAYDTSFAVLHGLYWLAANLAARQPLLLAVDDAHWADEPSLRWLAYLAPRLEGLALALLVTVRPAEPAALGAALLALRAEPATVVRPALLSEGGCGPSSAPRSASGRRTRSARRSGGRAAATRSTRPSCCGRSSETTGRWQRSNPPRCWRAGARGSRAGWWRARAASTPARWSWRRRSRCSGTAARCATRR